MARKRHKSRSFGREERRRERDAQLARAAAMSTEDVDRELIVAYFGAPALSALQVGEVWLELRELGELRKAREEQLFEALGREFYRLAGVVVSPAAIEELVAVEEDRREAEREASFLMTDVGWRRAPPTR